MARLSPDEARGLLDRFRRHLRESRLPVTRQRMAVAEGLVQADDHPSVEELQRRLRGKGERVGTATLYRTLDVLVKGGLAREHDFGEGFRRFEAVARESAGHEHLVCLRCGTVVEFANDRLERMLRLAADEQRFVYHHHRLEIHGLCARCRGRDLTSLAPAARP